MRILLTGAAGFIGAALCGRLLERGHEVAGIDNLNDYYDPRIKLERLRMLGISDPRRGRLQASGTHPAMRFERCDISDAASLERIWNEVAPDVCVNLAAQAGVRYSFENPRSYLDSNLTGFGNILERCRLSPSTRLVYASSSSVYGDNEKIPFSETDPTESQRSLYAATKKCDEILAGTYSELFGLDCTGLRFFTVYGPWGRPDMAPMLFADAILGMRPIKVFNNGDMSRDFTYIDDIVEGVVRIIERKHPAAAGRHRIYNIGHGHPEPLLRFISLLEEALGRKARLEMMPMQPGDVERTWADTSRLEADYGFHAPTPLEVGIRRFAEWRLANDRLFTTTKQN